MTTNWERLVDDNARRYRELHERVSRLSITETSPDGLVRVTVSADGQLTGLQLRDRWNPPPLPHVAAVIMSCVHHARARIPDLLRQAMFDTIGLGDPSAQLLLDQARKRFPPPPNAPPRVAPPERIASPAEPAPPAPPVTGAPPVAHDQDGWDGETVMEDV